MVYMFDYELVALEARIALDQLEELKKQIKEEFPDDEMMFELHVLRTCMAIRDGYITIEDALKVQLDL